MPACPTIFVVAGEASADQHAAMLGSELLRRGDVRLMGVGQSQMREAGYDLVFDSTGWSAMGVARSLTKVPLLWRRQRELRELLVRERPDLLILVDFGFFNVRLARAVKRRADIRTLYYFPPGSWRRAPSSFRSLAGVIDRIATPFSWSAEMLRASGLDATWVGHPVVDRIEPLDDKAPLRRELGLQPDATVIGLFPGSRRTEVRCNGPLVLAAARIIARQMPTAQFVVSVAPSIERSGLQAMAERLGPPGVRLSAGTVNIARIADLVITSAGTATLDAAAASCPMVVTYRGTTLMALENVVRRVDRLDVGMPNIVAGRRIVPELTGPRATGANLARAALEILTDEERYAVMRRDLREVRASLGEPGVSARVAEMALEMIAWAH